MFEKYLIMTRGFKNVSRNGKATGFQVKIRIPYYRGVFLSLVDNLQLTVDGETFPRDKLRISVGGRSFTIDEMENATNARWFFGDPATLTASKSGGLTPGMHTVELVINIRKSYIPKEDPEGLFGFSRGFWQPRPGGGSSGFGATTITKKMSLVQ